MKKLRVSFFLYFDGAGQLFRQMDKQLSKLVGPRKTAANKGL